MAKEATNIAKVVGEHLAFQREFAKHLPQYTRTEAVCNWTHADKVAARPVDSTWPVVCIEIGFRESRTSGQGGAALLTAPAARELVKQLIDALALL